MVIVPVSVVIYSKKQRSNLVICYLYLQFSMALYAFYVRWCNHSDSRLKADLRDSKYQDTDTLRWASLLMTAVTEVYQIQRFKK